MLTGARCEANIFGFVRKQRGGESRGAASGPPTSAACVTGRASTPVTIPTSVSKNSKDKTFAFLDAMNLADGLAEAVDAAIARDTSQEGKSERVPVDARSMTDWPRLKRLFEFGDLTEAEYLAARNDLFIERAQLE